MPYRGRATPAHLGLPPPQKQTIRLAHGPLLDPARMACWIASALHVISVCQVRVGLRALAIHPLQTKWVGHCSPKVVPHTADA